MEYIVYTDGADRHKGDFHIGAWGSYVKSEEDTRTRAAIVRNSEHFPVTNNRMELLAIIKTLEMCKENSKITLNSDSEYSVGVLSGEEHAHTNSDLIERYNEIVEEKHLEVNLHHIRREENAYIDGVMRYMLDRNEEAKAHDVLVDNN